MLPINHLKRTLDRCCGQWEFAGVPSRNFFVVTFLNTNTLYRINFDNVEWHAYEEVNPERPWANLCPFLTNRLNGHTRDDAGGPIYETRDKVLPC